MGKDGESDYPFRNKRLYQVVARQIARMIEEHADDPGWHLPSERELAEGLEVSRPSIREAVIALEMRGVVEVRGRAGSSSFPRKAARLASMPSTPILVPVRSNCSRRVLPSNRARLGSPPSV